MDFPSHVSVRDINASIVATSSDETLFVSSNGDVLVCRDFNSEDVQRSKCCNLHWSESMASDTLGYLQEQLEDCRLIEGTGSQRILITTDAKNEVTKNLWGEKHDNEFTCCGVQDCHSKGLCGGAEQERPSTTCDLNVHKGSSFDSCAHIGSIVTSTPTSLENPVNNGMSHHEGSYDDGTSEMSPATDTRATRTKETSRNSKSSASASQYSINDECTKKNDRKSEGNVPAINSSNSFGRMTLSIYTSTSIDDEEYDNLDINGVTLGDHGQFLASGRSSPTPVMSFDYSCYEPPTPEASRSYDYLEDDHVNRHERPRNGIRGSHVSMPNLNNGLDNDKLKDTINLPTGSNVPTNKQLLQPHPIPMRTHSNNPQERRSPPRPVAKPPDHSSGLPGIPTFLGHLSQIRITRVSAHPRGHHVLLVSNEGLLFSYGSNDRGQLGLGKQHLKANNPQLITPLLENGGKTINCAAGLDYSLVVVRTEAARIAHRRRQHQQQPPSTQNLNGKKAANVNERNAHHQMYGFGCNDNMKLGLLDPDKNLNKTYNNGSPRRRWRGNEADASLIDSPELASPCSLESVSGSLGDESFVSRSATMTSDVFLPRRVALHCKIIPKKGSHETITQQGKATVASLPYGIFCVAASTDHSAALVRRPSGSVELYTWGRGEEGRLGLPLPDGIDQTSTPTRRWDALCCTSLDNDDETLNSLIDESVSPGFDVNHTHSNPSALSQYFVATPTMVTPLSFMLGFEKAAHPPLPQRTNFDKRNHALPRSPRKNQRRNSPVAKNETKSLLQESEYLVKLALGPCCTHVITSTGRWLVFGSSSDGLLALGGNVDHSYQPKEVKLPLAFAFEKIASISIGEKHGIALTATGKAFTWGKSPYGALGHNNKVYIPIPQPIVLPNKTPFSRRIGEALNSRLALNLRGQKSTQSKTRNNDRSKETSSFDNSPVVYVHAGIDLSIFIRRSGSIQTCGRQSGRLGQGDVAMCVSTPTDIFGGIQLWRTDMNV
ncbi:hypothetical protein HJC23_000026 [Cyclotella cryptica]|uniref:Uncharacterized protein n=1 Tax=Cyclotella cryptica TaxID=29204 RepID=A0ABD3P183_9STRA|eukprot:CCRYP_018416-RA/>CCRYP_018416-RA protein AED:0.00 eAED:0.00 QI:206/-1/1/1/-1/1/1/172/1000